MAIEISEKFEVEAPIETVWQFVNEPAKVVTCMPGAELVEQVDDTRYLGRVKVKLGAMTTSYKGEVVFSDVNESEHTLQLVGEGKETGGGTAKGTVNISLKSTEAGAVEMSVDAQVDITGKVAQVGRGMIKGVSRQLFKQFAKNTKDRLESLDSAGEGPEGAATGTANEPDNAALAVAPLVGRTIWEGIVNFFRRLFGMAER
jgi:carbon monoxide dehydrogenase subunit G